MPDELKAGTLNPGQVYDNKGIPKNIIFSSLGSTDPRSLMNEPRTSADTRFLPRKRALTPIPTNSLHG